MRPRRTKGEEAGPFAWGTMGVILYLMFVGVVATILVLGMMSFKNSTVGIPASVREEVIMERMLLSQDCLTYTDPVTGRSIGALMDWSRFENDDAIRSCYAPIKDDWNVEVLLKALDGSNEERVVKTSEYVDGRYPNFQESRAVLIKKNGGTVGGRLIVRIQR